MRDACDITAVTVQLILTFAFLHLSLHQRERFQERHRVADYKLHSDSEPSATSNDDISCDNVTSVSEGESEATDLSDRDVISVSDSDKELVLSDQEEASYEVLDDREWEHWSEAEEDPQDVQPVPDIEDVVAEESTIQVGTIYCSSTRVTPRQVPLRLYASGPNSLLGPVERAPVDDIRRGDQWNGRPTFDPAYNCQP